ncbi:hypothetical protein ABMA27_007986 [Loxostege sticticalis]|uniref:F-box domain-containing protein n=1 Tax=Loxostege sticticalis TaxID=481309 RepID=A0ABR3HDN2_LOXSC
MSFLNLPVEVLLNILRSLELADLRNVMLSCRALRDIVLSNNSIWRTVCQNRLIVHNSTGNSNTSTLSCYKQCRISNNWSSGIYNSKVVIHHHTNYIPWLNFYNSQMLMLTVGSELRCYPIDRKGIPLCKNAIWKFEVPKVKRNDVRTNDISRFIMSGNLIVCGNRDGSTSVFEVSEEMKQKPRLIYYIEDCHENGELEVSAVELITDSEKSCAITGSSYHSSLLFWHFNTKGADTKAERDPSEFYVKEMKFSNDVGIRCLSLHQDNNKVAVGLSGSNMPLLVDINSIQLLMTAGLTGNRRLLTRDIKWHDPNTIITVTHSGLLQLTDIRTHQVVFDMMDPFQSSLYCVKSDGDRAIVAGTSEYSRCVLFDTRYHACHVQMYFTQRKSSPVYSLDFDSTKLIAAADRSVAVLDFNINSYGKKRRDYSEKFEFVNR